MLKRIGSPRMYDSWPSWSSAVVRPVTAAITADDIRRLVAEIHAAPSMPPLDESGKNILAMLQPECRDAMEKGSAIALTYEMHHRMSKQLPGPPFGESTRRTLRGMSIFVYSSLPLYARAIWREFDGTFTLMFEEDDGT